MSVTTKKSWLHTSVLVLAISVFFVTARASVIDPTLSQYQFPKTRSLVQMVRQAAELFHQKGPAVFASFSKNPSQWYQGNRYIFIYDLSGTNIFHAADPKLQRENLFDFKDLYGRPVIQMMINIASRKKQPYGWVHYLWFEPGQIEPRWKSSYVMRVTAPDGKLYFIGSGIYQMRNEPAFIKQAVNAAAKHLQNRGMAGLPDLSNPSKPFLFKNFYLFVIDTKGKLWLDPAFPHHNANIFGMNRRSLLAFTDAVGTKVIAKAIDMLRQQDTVWLIYIWPKPNQTRLARKIMYLHKVQVNGKTLIVGSDLYLQMPIWMTG